MSKPKHTPTPWTADGSYIAGPVPNGRPGGEYIANFRPTVPKLSCPNEANAAHAVHCVNCHDELVAVIEGALRIKELWLYTGTDPEHEAEGQALCSMQRLFEAALAKAKEE